MDLGTKLSVPHFFDPENIEIIELENFNFLNNSELEPLYKPEEDTVRLFRLENPPTYNDLEFEKYVDKYIGVFGNRGYSAEEYLGKLPIVKDVIDHFTNIRNIMVRFTNTRLNDSIRKMVLDEFKKMETKLAAHFNVASVTIGLHTAYDMLVLPLAFGQLDAGVGIDKQEYFKQISDIEITPTGIRFTKPDAKHIIIFLSKPLLMHEKITPEILTAGLFFNIGVNFPSFKNNMSAKTQLVVRNLNTLTTLITSLGRSLMITGSSRDPSTVGFILHVIFKGLIFDKVSACFSTLFNRLSKRDDAELSKEIVLMGYNRKEDKDYVTLMQEIIEQIQTILGFIGLGVATISLSMAAPVLFIMSQVLNLVNIPARLENQAKKITDTFNTTYGLSVEHSQFLLLYRSVLNNSKGLLWLTKQLPWLNTIVKIPTLSFSMLSSALSGQPSEASRIRNMYKELVKESNNPNLSDKLRTDIQAEIRQMETIYVNIINPNLKKDEDRKGFFVFSIITRIIGKILKNQDRNTDPKKLGIYAKDVIKNSGDISSSLLGVSNLKELTDNVNFDKIDDVGMEDVIFIEPKNNESINYSFDAVLEGFDFTDSRKQYFPQEFYESMGSLAEEAYFGKTAIVQRLIELFGELRNLFPKKGTANPEQRVSIRDKLKEIGDICATHWNTEKFYVGLEEDFNASTFSLATGGTKEELKTYSQAKILETSEGYKFESNKGLNIYIQMGLKLMLDSSLSDEIVTAIFFHEIGHNFAKIDIGNVFKYKSAQNGASIISYFKSITESILTLEFILHPIRFIFFTFKYIGGILSKVFKPFDFSRAEAEKYAEDETNRVLTGKIDKDASNVWESHILDDLLECIMWLVYSVLSILPIPIIPSFLMAIINDPAMVLDILTLSYITKRKKDESFADAFAAKYGLGPHLSDAMFKFYSLRKPTGFQKIPFIGLIAQLNTIGTTAILTSLSGYPSNRDRIVQIYTSLKKELNNPTIPQDLKNQLLTELTNIESTYSHLISPTSNIKSGRWGRAFLYLIFRIFFKLKAASVKNKEEFINKSNISKTMVFANVTSTLKESKDLKDMVEIKDVDIDSSEERLLDDAILFK